MKIPSILGLAAGMAPPAFATIIPVTTIAPNGARSLQQAIVGTNACVGMPDTIIFDLPDDGVQTIQLTAERLEFNFYQ